MCALVFLKAPSVPAAYDALKDKRARDFVLAPAKSLPMQAFMLYRDMSSGGVQIFSMGIVLMLLLTPFKNVAGTAEGFAAFAPAGAPPRALTTLPLQKLAYLACNLLTATLTLGLWNCRSMGFGDWLAFETHGMAPEILLY